MIITSKGTGCIGVPCKGDTTEIAHIVPGVSELDDRLWGLARHNARRLIAEETIVEEWIKIDRANAEGNVLVIDSPDEREKAKVLVPAKLSDVDRKGQKVFTLVKGTYHLPTLKKWYEEELRADVRVEINKQITGVESGDIKG